MESLAVGVPPGNDAQHKPEKANSLIHIYNLISPQAAGAAGERRKKINKVFYFRRQVPATYMTKR